MVGSNLGEAFSIEFCAWLKLTTKINIRELLETPKKIKEFEGKIDLLYAIVSELPSLFKKEDKLLPKILKVVEILQPEFAILTLRMLKETNEKVFRAEAVKHSFIGDYGKYLL